MMQVICKSNHLQYKNKIMKYQFSIVIFIMIFLFLNESKAQSKQEIKVQNAIDELTRAMISGNRADLEIIASIKLSYGHSGGHVEGKTEFVEKIASGKSDFISIDISEQTISIVKNTAIVRHQLTAVTNDNGKSGNVKLKVLLVFLKENGHWSMIARQAVKG